jgi:outer membrane lipoprotein SlyB
MKLLSIVLTGILVAAIGCAPYPGSQRTYEGAGAGAIIGGVAGGLLKGWKGAVIGGALGAVAGATITEISAQAAREAAVNNRPVEYKSDDGRYVVHTEPRGFDERTKCDKVHEKIWEDGRLVRDEIKEVCRSTKEERRY